MGRVEVPEAGGDGQDRHTTARRVDRSDRRPDRARRLRQPSGAGRRVAGVPSTQTVREAAPTAVAGAKRVESLSALSSGSGLRSGDLVELRLDETSLSQDVTRYIRESASGIAVSNTSVQLRPGQVVFTGSLRQGVLATEFTMTSHPAIQGGRLLLVVDSIEPGLVGQFSPVKAGEGIDLAPTLSAQSARVVTGLMVVVGVVK